MVILISSPREYHLNVQLILLDSGCHIANGDANSWPDAFVRFRSVDEVGVMKGRLARQQHDIDGPGLVQVARNRQALFQNVGLLRFFQLLEVSRVCAWQDPEAPILDCAHIRTVQFTSRAPVPVRDAANKLST